MNTSITAIYEKGVLRPLKPLNLAEQVQVQIIIQPINAQPVEKPKPTMVELWAELDYLNQFEPEIELPPRQDRPNALLEMPDEFFI